VAGGAEGGPEGDAPKGSYCLFDNDGFIGEIGVWAYPHDAFAATALAVGAGGFLVLAPGAKDFDILRGRFAGQEFFIGVYVPKAQS